MPKKKEEKKSQKVGRPSKKNTILLKQIKELATFGLTDEQIAAFCEIAVSTLYEYKKKWPEFSEALKAGKEISDGQVIKSLYQRATGYEHPELKVFCDKGRIVTAKVIKHYPPDATSMIFWLKNRRPDEWRDKQEHSIPELESIGKALMEAAKRANDGKD